MMLGFLGNGTVPLGSPRGVGYPVRGGGCTYYSEHREVPSYDTITYLGIDNTDDTIPRVHPRIYATLCFRYLPGT